MRQTIIRRLRMLCCVVAIPAVVQGAQFAGQARAPPLPAMDFTLKGSNGSEFRLTQHQGKIALLSFGYTFCPDVCPTTLLAELSQVRARLEEAAKRVQVAFIGGFVRED
jgi:protein SCO1/2